MPRGAAIPVEQCFRLGKAWYEGRLDLAWRPKSAEEVAAIFDKVGLTGDFWSLG
jgi:hypothetical protein